MRTTAARVVLIAAIVVASCNEDGDEPAVLERRAIPAELPGCYEVALDSSIAAPQPRDTIDLVPAGATDSVMSVPGPRPWSVDSLADSIRIEDPVGMEPGGTRYVLGFRLGGDTLRGRLILHTDVGPPFMYDGGPIQAVRIPCRRRAASSDVSLQRTRDLGTPAALAIVDSPAAELWRYTPPNSVYAKPGRSEIHSSILHG